VFLTSECLQHSRQDDQEEGCGDLDSPGKGLAMQAHLSEQQTVMS
jgi:hypothetical protein